MVVFAPHTHAKKKEVDGYFALFLFCFFVLDPTTSHSFDRSIFFKNRDRSQKENKRKKRKSPTTPTPQHRHKSSTEKHPKGGRANQTAVSRKKRRRKKTREEETKREVKRKRDERDGGEGWRRFWRDLEFDDDDDDDGTTTTTTTTLR